MQFDLDRGSREPLYRQLAGSLQQRIRSGALPPRTRLPTVRQLAQQLGITRLTVHSAYAELQSGGWIEATVGRGTFVAEQIDQLIVPPTSELGREATPAGMLADLLRMTQLPGLSALARADPAPDLFPLRNWQRASELALASGGSSMMNYTTPPGRPDPALDPGRGRTRARHQRRARRAADRGRGHQRHGVGHQPAGPPRRDSAG